MQTAGPEAGGFTGAYGVKGLGFRGPMGLRD